MSNIIVVGPEDCPAKTSLLDNFVNTTSRSPGFGKELSPFTLGPVYLYEGAPTGFAQNVENAWQYSKIYSEYVGEDGLPTQEYFDWAVRGFSRVKADRYPKGRGAIPSYAWWGKKLGYLAARREIYIPLYKEAVIETESFARLKEMYDKYQTLMLWCYDGYNHKRLNMSYDDVINCGSRSMGHSFVLAMILDGHV